MVRLSDLPGVTTNNQAEYVALISALVDLHGRIARAGKSLRSYSAAAHTNSQLLVGQLTQGWQIKAARLHSLADKATPLIQASRHHDLVKVSRDEFVRVLGHWPGFQNGLHYLCALQICCVKKTKSCLLTTGQEYARIRTDVNSHL